jgi:predicted O-linked N-acetylglucosamine transferase (SPINDLY family)
MVDWVAETPEEFVAIAKSKSQDIAGLASLRMGLRERFSQSTLGSPERFALEFESALAEAYAVAWASEPVRG